MPGICQCKTQGKIRPSTEVLAELGKAPYQFRLKKAIAIINGTAVMNFEDDRPLENDLRKTLELIEKRHFSV